MSSNLVQRARFDFLAKAALVLLTFQLGALAAILAAQGFEGLPDGFVVMLVCTVPFVTVHRRLAARGDNGGGSWIVAARATALGVLAAVSIVIVFDMYLRPPVPQIAVRAVFVALWAAIALKGAAAGKFKPGGLLGLRVHWTLSSRLAWDKAHRMLGRVLFWGGLFGLAASFFVPPPVSLVQWIAVIALAVSLALFESWRTWRADPERSSG
jgi:uncharacterized membrane protein